MNWLDKVLLTIIIISLAAMLSACGTPAEPRIIYKTVSVPVPVRCTPAVPPNGPFEYDLLVPPADLQAHAQALYIDRQQRITTMAQYLAALQACKGTP